MTRLATIPADCKICGASHSRTVFLSTHSYGTPDLDTRPPPDEGFAILRAINCCPNCGYCAPSTSEPPEGAERIVYGPDYRQELEGAPGPARAQHWHSWSLLCEKTGQKAAARQASLRAVWATDDARDHKASEHYRRRSIDLFLTALDEATANEERVLNLLVLMDLSRRTGDFARALRHAEDALSIAHSEGTQSIASFQRLLAQRGDCRRYKFEDAKAYAESPEKWLAQRERRDSKRWWQFWRQGNPGG